MSLEEKVEKILSAHFAASDDDVSLSGLMHKPGHHHLILQICSAEFEGMSRLARSRLIHSLLADQFAQDDIHALKMTLRAPSEI